MVIPSGPPVVFNPPPVRIEDEKMPTRRRPCARPGCPGTASVTTPSGCCTTICAAAMRQGEWLAHNAGLDNDEGQAEYLRVMASELAVLNKHLDNYAEVMKIASIERSHVHKKSQKLR